MMACTRRQPVHGHWGAERGVRMGQCGWQYRHRSFSVDVGVNVEVRETVRADTGVRWTSPWLQSAAYVLHRRRWRRSKRYRQFGMQSVPCSWYPEVHRFGLVLHPAHAARQRTTQNVRRLIVVLLRIPSLCARGHERFMVSSCDSLMVECSRGHRRRAVAGRPPAMSA